MESLRLFSLLFLLFLRGTLATTDPDYDELLEEMKSQSVPGRVLSEDKIEFNKKLALAVLSNRVCENSVNSWKCRPECKLEFPSNSTDYPKKCRQPEPGLKCFGVSINYSYVDEQPDFAFPSEYIVLNNFPRCWRALAPLMCVRFYRPCAYHEFYHKTTEGKLETGIMEVWSRVRRQTCQIARKMCVDVIKEGFFPEWMECQDDVPIIFSNSTLSNYTFSSPRKFYSDKCAVGRLPIVSEVSGKCPHPLTEIPIDKVTSTRPVIDSCYLPCRSTQISDHDRNHQISVQSTLGLAFFIIFFSISLYLLLFSKIYQKSLATYSITFALFWISIYFLIWFSTGINKLADTAECTGALRRNDYLKAFDWCVLQSILLHTSFLAAFVWLLAHFIFNVWSPMLQDNVKVRGVKIRGFLMLVITAPCLFISLIFAPSEILEFDGVSGICHIGLMSSWKYVLFFGFPIGVTFLGFGIYCFFIHYTRENVVAEETLNEVKSRIPAIEDYYRLRVYRYLWLQLKGARDDLKTDDLKKVEIEEVRAAEENGTLDKPKYPDELVLDYRCIEERDKKPGSIFDRKRKLFEKDEAEKIDISSLIIPKDELMNTLGELYAFNYAARMASIRERYRNSMYPRWSLSITVVTIAVFFISCIIHVCFINSDPEFEVLNIQRNVQCKIRSMLHNGTLDWMDDNNYEGHECELGILYSPYRADAIIAVFVLLPALPFLIVALAFMTGWYSSGGMPRIRLVREDWKTLCSPLSGDEVELDTLVKDESMDFPSSNCKRFLSSENVCSKNSSLSVSLSDSCSQRELEERGYDSSKRSDIQQRKKIIQEDVAPNCTSENNFISKDNNAELNTFLKFVQTSAIRDGAWTERQRHLLDLMKDLSAYLNYTKYMLNNDSVAWTLVLDVLTRIDTLFKEVFPSHDPAAMQGNNMQKFMQNFHSLFSELNLVIPTVSDHASNLSGWIAAVQDAITTLRCATNGISNVSKVTKTIEEKSPIIIPNPSTDVFSKLYNPPPVSSTTSASVSSTVANSGSFAGSAPIAIGSTVVGGSKCSVPKQKVESKEVESNLLQKSAPFPVPVANNQCSSKLSPPPAKKQAATAPTSRVPDNPVARAFAAAPILNNPERPSSNTRNVSSSGVPTTNSASSVATSGNAKAKLKANANSNDNVLTHANVTAGSSAPASAAAVQQQPNGMNRLGPAPQPRGLLFPISFAPAGAATPLFTIPFGPALVPNGLPFPNQNQGLFGTPGTMSSAASGGIQPIRFGPPVNLGQALPASSNGNETASNQSRRPAQNAQQTQRSRQPQQQVSSQQPQQPQIQQQLQPQPQGQVQPQIPPQLQPQRLFQQNAVQTNAGPSTSRGNPQAAAGAGPSNPQEPPNRPGNHEDILNMILNGMQNNQRPPAQQPQQAGPSAAPPARVGPSNVISGYTESYSAVPRGFFTFLTDDEIRLRAARLREICNERLYPQEIIYILMLTGDIRNASNKVPRENERLVKVASYRSMFGDSPCINIAFSPDVFLRCMRRRALTLVGAIGYHYSKCERPFNEYHPPVLPPLGMEEMENELTMGRILGADALLPIRNLIREFNQGFSPVHYRPELDNIRFFTSYLDAFATSQGFPVQREEFVPDPEPRVILDPPNAENSSEDDGQEADQAGPSNDVNG